MGTKERKKRRKKKADGKEGKKEREKERNIKKVNKEKKKKGEKIKKKKRSESPLFRRDVKDFPMNFKKAFFSFLCIISIYKHCNPPISPILKKGKNNF